MAELGFPRLLTVRFAHLALPLLVTRVLADHEDGAVAPDDLALLAHRLDRRSYLQASLSAVPVASLWQPVRLPLRGRGVAHGSRAGSERDR
jgi:hypothetical protein